MEFQAVAGGVAVYFLNRTRARSSPGGPGRSAGRCRGTRAGTGLRLARNSGPLTAEESTCTFSPVSAPGSTARTALPMRTRCCSCAWLVAAGWPPWLECRGYRAGDHDREHGGDREKRSPSSESQACPHYGLGLPRHRHGPAAHGRGRSAIPGSTRQGSVVGVNGALHQLDGFCHWTELYNRVRFGAMRQPSVSMAPGSRSVRRSITDGASLALLCARPGRPEAARVSARRSPAPGERPI